MSELTKATDKLLCIYEDAELQISLLSFLVLEYHASLDEHLMGHDSLYNFYGYTDNQLLTAYEELEYYGYVVQKKEYISFTNKTKQLFNSKVNRLTTIERERLEKTFEIFWKAYPVRVGKKKAKFEWMKLRPDKNLYDTIIKSIDTQIKYKAQEERKGKFVPEFQHAERWLRNERYNDECVVGKNFIGKLTNNKPKRDER
jgi:hypothetical protein|tara:strand:- start:450 stop:1049 length:600 start_codon:yes stop_codon:yes gene_type:complete